MTIETARLLQTGASTSLDASELTLVVGGSKLGGWQEIEVTLRAEGFPNNFSIGCTDHENVGTLTAGARCDVYLGNNQVITGYVDTVAKVGDSTGDLVHVAGRGLTADLVDCSAEWPAGEIINGSLIEIARKLLLPYKLDVALENGATADQQVPEWLLNYGETPAAIIQRISQAAGLLAYEDASGRLLFGRVGTTTAASGVVYGENVERWQAESSMGQRFSEIVCARYATDILDVDGASTFYDRAVDPNVPRHRLLYMVAEGVGADDPYEFTSMKAKVEAARRMGRSRVVRATIDSWRDKAGALWKPNSVVPVSVPGAPDGDMILGEVVFRRSGESGTTADLTLMPREAFTPEPVSLQKFATPDIRGA